MTDDPSCTRNARLEDAVLAAQMRAAQAGDRSAYAGLLRCVTPWLRQYVRSRRRFLQAADVEDLVQEVLLSLHAVRRTYDPERPFLPWLLAITHNRLADAARRHASRSAREASAEGLDSGDRGRDVTSRDESTNTDEGAVGDPQALRRAIRALPAGQRAAIDLLKLREMSLKEAARELGTTVGALKVSVHRAMASLKRSLVRR
jgi:RNA polymerase sigma-70 factor (ECF subfamily)